MMILLRSQWASVCHGKEAKEKVSPIRRLRSSGHISPLVLHIRMKQQRGRESLMETVRVVDGISAADFRQCWIAGLSPHWLSRDEQSLDVGSARRGPTRLLQKNGKRIGS